MKTRMFLFLKRPATLAFLATAAVYAVAMAAIFWGTWSLDLAPVEPDNPTSYPLDHTAKWLTALLAGGDFVPGDLRNLIGSPYFWQELQYAVPCFIAALGMAFYLRGRRLSLLASYGAGAAYGLMGYNVTLYSAGHLGWFVWMTYGPFAFGLIDRCVRKGRWRNWVLLGAVLAWASARQPDLWLLFTLLSFFYGVWCVIVNRRFASPRMWLGVLLAAATMFACGWPQLRRAIFIDTANRDKQIADSSGRSDRSNSVRPSNLKEDKSPEEKKLEETKRWDFCTSWSLPPDEAMEFFVASPKGDSSDPRVNPANPYKGRIGQRVTIPDGQCARDPMTGRILSGGDVFYMPYRQHSLYFGLITCILALIGVVSVFWRRKAATKSDSPDVAASSRRSISDVFFWTAAFVVCLFCAFGGFTPFYRLVYVLPMGDYIRCPVKFVHLLEFCAAALAGFGIQAILDFAKEKNIAKPVAYAVAFFALVNVVDLARVDSRYLAVEDVTFIRADNAAADAIRKAGGGKTLIAVDPAEGRDAIASSFGAHLVETGDGDNARFVFATQRGLKANPKHEEMMRTGKLKMLGAFAWQKGKGIYATPQNGAAALFQVQGVEPPKQETPPSPDRTAQFFTWLSIICSFAALAWAAWPGWPSAARPSNLGDIAGSIDAR